MTHFRFFFRAFAIAAMMLWVSAGSVIAQPKEPIQPEPGLCAPWHKCMAQGAMILIGLTTLLLIAGYAWQRRGFHTVEHRQGNPDGVPVKREQ